MEVDFEAPGASPTGLTPDEIADETWLRFADVLSERYSAVVSGMVGQLAEFLEDAKPVRAVPADVADYRTLALGPTDPQQVVGFSMKRRRVTVLNITGTAAAPNIATLPDGAVIWLSTSPTGGTGNRFPLLPGAAYDHEAKSELYVQCDTADAGFVAIAGSEYED